MYLTESIALQLDLLVKFVISNVMNVFNAIAGRNLNIGPIRFQLFDLMKYRLKLKLYVSWQKITQKKKNLSFAQLIADRGEIQPQISHIAFIVTKVEQVFMKDRIE